ncbi:MAG: MoxR family ATPase [Ruminococcaceae bacterium]|nr:MoxR family ATPase [Oscillospiraceae bacterium]
MSHIQKIHQAVSKRVGKVIVGKERVTDLAVIALLCGGHMLIDDVPGTGKTVLAKTFASALSLDFKRVQCVPDMLPSDLVGVNFFDMKASEFRFIKGPVFTNILLADEINRAMPKTQSGLLECMEEHQVTVEGVTYPLSEPFMVIATQNPVETKGTFDLPEAQLDRFLIKTTMGYPSHEENVEILSRKLKPLDPKEQTDAVLDAAVIKKAQRELSEIYVHPDLLSYAASICEETRYGKNVVLGASPRAMISLIRVAQGYAGLDGRDHVLPDDIKKAAVPTLSHRIVFQNMFFKNGDPGADLILQILEQTPVPSEQIDFCRR